MRPTLGPAHRGSEEALAAGERDLERDSAGFGSREPMLVLRWTSPARSVSLSDFDLAHWEFLFVISALLGPYGLHALSRIEEGNDVSERMAMQQLGLEALRSLNHLSTPGGALLAVFPFRRLSERRRLARSARRARFTRGSRLTAATSPLREECASDLRRSHEARPCATTLVTAQEEPGTDGCGDAEGRVAPHGRAQVPPLAWSPSFPVAIRVRVAVGMARRLAGVGADREFGVDIGG